MNNKEKFMIALKNEVLKNKSKKSDLIKLVTESILNLAGGSYDEKIELIKFYDEFLALICLYHAYKENVLKGGHALYYELNFKPETFNNAMDRHNCLFEYLDVYIAKSKMSEKMLFVIDGFIDRLDIGYEKVMDFDSLDDIFKQNYKKLNSLLNKRLKKYIK